MKLYNKKLLVEYLLVFRGVNCSYLRFMLSQFILKGGSVNLKYLLMSGLVVGEKILSLDWG